ncbi:MAG: NAD(+) synthase [Rhodospirillales bacterium]|nr:NAD(+) synthase [Rhodospirillales bacterium]
MRFSALYRHGFARVAACGAVAHPGDPAANAGSILALARHADAAGAALAVFPELSLSGYAIDDLLLADVLLDAVQKEAARLIAASAALRPLLLVGAPLAWHGRLYNCALAIQRGRLLGVVAKSYLPNYREFYERRHFAAGAGIAGATIHAGGQEAPFGTDLLFAATDLDGFVVHAEICEDVWVPAPPSTAAALAGATVLANLSASNITIAKAEERNLLCRSQSARCHAAYLYAAAGAGESTTDLAWDGQASIFENGVPLAETARFLIGPGIAEEARIALADIDLDRLRQERLRQGTFADNAAAHAAVFRQIGFTVEPPDSDLGLMRPLARHPFVPADPARLAQDCYEAYNIQVAGLLQRLSATATKRVVIGVSGGLDSTQALIVAARTFDLLGLPRSDILAYTMPGFATGSESRALAHALMRALGVGAQELDIRPAAQQMLRDLDHPFAAGQPIYDITFENVQAGLRTDYLFRLANRHHALVLGTGDLSELALGWCTYGVGDQMSHYNVNAGVPKTLIQHLIRWVIADGQFAGAVNDTLGAILAAEISPELVPVAEGARPQSTEATIGPYDLQDFTLYYTLRYGFRPSRIAFLAWRAWGDATQGEWPKGYPLDKRRGYDLPAIKHWMEVFLRRFFAFSQFKRSAMPNGPKVSPGGSLSPRGDWRAPSDGSARIWLADLARVPDDPHAECGPGGMAGE